MKKLVLLLVLVLLLAACGDSETNLVENPEEENSEETAVQTESSEEQTVETAEEESLVLTDDNLLEVIEFNGTGEGDKVVEALIDGTEVQAVIELAPNELLDPENLATTRYAQVSDELLYYDGWETLSIEYVGIGSISIERSEQETNEYGMVYFPSEVIIDRLN